ncbi:septation ring formation regulator EzrA [Sporosarcina jiandibaonis]|uniref:septation ring formation regulator EzrA n=1 Tax=Sporosarcina jiandibaonis TaxID=2715535 RepID=UPI001553F80E|nr:septation ring formation regulator EzrA [Sporosarcina jiandibaonis]
MKYLIIPIIALIIIIIIAFLYRRKHIRQIAKLEEKKLQIQHEPIFEEMTKIKLLNMTGETEEKFERWRHEWTEVMDIHMIEIDSLLFDAEDYVDRFQFGKATKVEAEIEEKIQYCDKKMTDILAELNELVGSEEKNRIEMELLKEQHRAARKKVLAHQHSYGTTVKSLEAELESFNPKFAEYDELTANGNYLRAREIVITQSERGEYVFSLIDRIPSLLAELQNKIPAAIRELRNGSKGMEEQSYYLQHLELPKQFDDIEKKLETLIGDVESLKIDSIQTEIDAINERIESFYDALENEVTAKQFVDGRHMLIAEKLADVIKLTKATNDEAALVQQSYRLNEEESEIPTEAVEQLEKLNERFEMVTIRIEDEGSAASSLQEELAAIESEIDRIAIIRESFAERIKSLRIDENSVRKELNRLTKKMQDVERSLYKGNIPGIPDEMDARLEEAEEQIYIVNQSLEEVPLNMNLVNNYLENAKQSVDVVSEKVEELLENVMLVEWIIQYGNRYRTSNEEVHRRLLEAENSFREFRYEKALEEAATAVEDVEPGAMNRIEELVQENSSIEVVK